MMRFVVESKGRRKRKSENQMPKVKVAEPPEVEIRETLISRFYPPLLVESDISGTPYFPTPVLGTQDRSRHFGNLDIRTMITISGFKTSDQVPPL